MPLLLSRLGWEWRSDVRVVYRWKSCICGTEQNGEWVSTVSPLATLTDDNLWETDRSEPEESKYRSSVCLISQQANPSFSIRRLTLFNNTADIAKGLLIANPYVELCTNNQHFEQPFLTTDDNEMLACNGTTTTAVTIFSIFPFSLTFYLSVSESESEECGVPSLQMLSQGSDKAVFVCLSPVLTESEECSVEEHANSVNNKSSALSSSTSRLACLLLVDESASASIDGQVGSGMETDSSDAVKIVDGRLVTFQVNSPAVSDINNRTSFLSAHSFAALSITESSFAEITSTLLQSSVHHICRQLVAHCSDLPQRIIRKRISDLRSSFVKLSQIAHEPSQRSTPTLLRGRSLVSVNDASV
ncbi:hypothetical protein BLNAU_18733 [Blattamonas nauphoetae]|uniref:Uncharacterized protein n=1 Tax=Blattamonas nauphoetae TaxID=2049346 RepID=A0ABQ9X3W6_9EUKA|nr:hypothetical protein BLNAU_18733 [Blattamonas nauphoetae]